MYARSEAKLNMYHSTQKHCADHPDVVASVPAFAKTFDSFNANISAIMALSQQEDLATKGITLDKATAKNLLCQLAADIAAPIFAFASATGNNKLKQEVKFTAAGLLRTKDDVLGPRCQNIKDKGTENVTALKPWGITDTSLEALQTAIDGYLAKTPTPRNSTAEKKTIRNNIKKLFAETDLLLKDQLDKIVVGVQISSPDFYATYKENRIIIDPAKSTTTLKGRVQNASNRSAVKGALILVKETGNQATANAAGNYEIKPMAAGTYTVIISATGFKEKTEEQIKVKQGQNTTLVSQLSPE